MLIDVLQSTLGNGHKCLHMVAMTLAIVVHRAHARCGPRGHSVHCCALFAHCSEDVGQCSLMCCKAHWTMAIGYPDIGNGGALRVLCHMTWNMVCTMGCVRKDSITRSAPIRRLAMAPKAMKVAKRHRAMKAVHKAKSKATQNHKAKVPKVNRKL